jgi:membrane associated rhomboid family serine protease
MPATDPSTVRTEMSLLDKLERRLGFLAIPGLIRIVVAFNALVFVLVYLNPDFKFVLDLNPSRILHGQVWRLVTYIFLPQTFSPWWIIFVLWFLWFIGDGLEQAWGPFRLTLYFFVGMIGTTAAAFFFGSNFSNSMLIAALFFAFATFYPNEVIYIFFILPVKVKWVACVMAAFLLYGFVVATNSYRVALVVALSNYAIFFGPGFFREARQRQEATSRRKRFVEDARPETEALHHCATCSATELTDPTLDFRVASDGEEYCLAHLPSAVNSNR